MRIRTMYKFRNYHAKLSFSQSETYIRIPTNRYPHFAYCFYPLKLLPNTLRCSLLTAHCSSHAYVGPNWNSSLPEWHITHTLNLYSFLADVLGNFEWKTPTHTTLRSDKIYLQFSI